MGQLSVAEVWLGTGSLLIVCEPVGTGSDTECTEGWVCPPADLLSGMGALADLTTNTVGLMVGLGCQRTREHRPQILVVGQRLGSREWIL